MEEPPAEGSNNSVLSELLDTGIKKKGWDTVRQLTLRVSKTSGVYSRCQFESLLFGGP
jgi:hypothetical protein